VDLAPNLGGGGHVVPPQEASAGGGRRGGQEPLRLGTAAAAGRGQRGDAARESPPPGHASVAPEIGGGEMSLEKKSETKGRAAAAARFGGLGTEAPPVTRAVEEGYVDTPVLPRPAVECACTKRPKPTRGLYTCVSYYFGYGINLHFW
jgi:hypothetical protein